MRLWNVVIGSALLSFVAAACGGGDDAKKDDTSSLDSKKVSELDTGEVKTLCQWFDTVGDDKITDRQSCTQEGADSASSVDECEEYRDECLDELADDGGDECDDFDVSKSCTVKVSVLKNCIAALAKAYDDAARNATCEKYEAAQVNDLPAACKAVPDSCLTYEVDISVGGKSSSLLGR